MKKLMKDGGIATVMHAIFRGSQQLTAWRINKQETIAALHRSSHHDEMDRKTERGAPRVRDRSYTGLTIQSKVCVTPPRQVAA